MDIILNYGNFYHILMIVLPIGFAIGSYFLFRKSKKWIKFLFVFILMLLNLVQHIFKKQFWFSLYGGGIDPLIVTAYNFCALMIILDPISMILPKCSLKQAINTMGMVAGFAAILVPYWFVGNSIITMEFVRYYLCHFLLASANLLALLYDFNDTRIKNFYKIPCYYIMFKLIIFANDIVLYSYLGNSLSEAYNLTKAANPIILFKPVNIPLMEKFFEVVTPKIFISNGEYIPVLYSLIPEFLLVMVGSLLIELIYTLVKRKKNN